MELGTDLRLVCSIEGLIPPLLLRQLERALEEVESRRSVLNHDFENIEAEGDVLTIQHAQPCASATADEFLFLLCHGVGRTRQIIATPGFDFDEDERVFIAIAANKIHLAAVVGPEVPVKDLKAVPL